MEMDEEEEEEEEEQKTSRTVKEVEDSLAKFRVIEEEEGEKVEVEEELEKAERNFLKGGFQAWSPNHTVDLSHMTYRSVWNPKKSRNS
ncbi:hypothetical protein B9Z55_009759 [Caenorhabditis nigoni]|uniref:Uncharacterized protein n=1 Tax=Caenorhabditis nigoni TaxID=1611254 RepID=A0A2G5UTE7_9PELO|nr:hypothetical protein B9Z55_009759 [Caenorhabditis nigoni]